MSENPVDKNDLFQSLPKEWPVDLRREIQGEVAAGGRKVVVLDDDPTGTQTVHGIPVLTEWSTEALRPELETELSAFYILTNSRSLPLPMARSLNMEIGRNLVRASQGLNRSFVVVSRSDSTLRGHFPGEVEALADGLEQSFDGRLIVPFFLEGGRYTVNDTHYVDERGQLIPAGHTEFAHDTVFGYRSSNLCDWVEEKTEGRVPAKEVLSISIRDLREGGPIRVTERLMSLAGGAHGVVNAASYRDLEVFVRGLLEAEAQGRRFIYRTAASFVQVRAGIMPRPLLSREDLNLSDSGGGLTIVGSHVPRTTRQLDEVLRLPGIRGLEIRVEALLDEGLREGEMGRIAQMAETSLRKAEDVVIYTSRRLQTARQREENLLIGRRVSDGLITVLNRISTRPRYLVGKGGITASDVATGGLHVKRALVLGQILPGVPVWQLGGESRFPGIPYVVFPGNVGDSGALAEVIKMLKTVT